MTLDDMQQHDDSAAEIASLAVVAGITRAAARLVYAAIADRPIRTTIRTAKACQAARDQDTRQRWSKRIGR